MRVVPQRQVSDDRLDRPPARLVDHPPRDPYPAPELDVESDRPEALRIADRLLDLDVRLILGDRRRGCCPRPWASPRRGTGPGHRWWSRPWSTTARPSRRGSAGRCRRRARSPRPCDRGRGRQLESRTEQLERFPVVAGDGQRLEGGVGGGHGVDHRFHDRFALDGQADDPVPAEPVHAEAAVGAGPDGGDRPRLVQHELPPHQVVPQVTRARPGPRRIATSRGTHRAGRRSRRRKSVASGTPRPSRPRIRPSIGTSSRTRRIATGFAAAWRSILTHPGPEPGANAARNVGRSSRSASSSAARGTAASKRPSGPLVARRSGGFWLLGPLTTIDAPATGLPSGSRTCPRKTRESSRALPSGCGSCPFAAVSASRARHPGPGAGARLIRGSERRRHGRSRRPTPPG